MRRVRDWPQRRGNYIVSLMPGAAARFRLSIKDRKAGTAFKVELIDPTGPWGERRFGEAFLLAGSGVFRLARR